MGVAVADEQAEQGRSQNVNAIPNHLVQRAGTTHVLTGAEMQAQDVHVAA